MVLGVWISCLVVTCILLSFHGCSIYVSFTSKELQKNRFLLLALYLSLSDSVIGLGFIYISILNLLNNQTVEYRYQCMFIKHFLSGAVISSLIQTLIICFERLNATYVPKLKILQILTSNKTVIICFVLCHIFAVTRFIIDALYGRMDPCHVKQTTHPVALFSHDAPAMIIVSFIVILYAIILARVKKQQHKIGIQSSTVENQIGKRKLETHRMRRNNTTLGIIISVALLAVLPRSILVFYVYSIGASDELMSLLWIANNIFMLFNPLLDPVIYVLRMKKYRQHLRFWKSNKLSTMNTNTSGPS